ncbi:MAG: SDR family NAD(P)-dependent oxidoreductase, partial [Sulfitobacter sp.]|nr:SDR family NAD(P)-dependent oxidoreductase [Sulfitobacter sp.]
MTGGSRGIGLEAALAFAREGARPILASRDAASLAQAALAVQEITGTDCAVFAGDLGQDQARQDLAAAFPDIDILVN